ncbi:hypothetical protein [Streptomyces qinglanensis]|uniref:hypothetical protein n=1 Tax=Streptomyces qinglanensis TaxID=943816 RepID=UPI0013A6CC22|nr:hypothetical protein [Streptomyces qinglanensis]
MRRLRRVRRVPPGGTGALGAGCGLGIGTRGVAVVGAIGVVGKGSVFGADAG